MEFLINPFHNFVGGPFHEPIGAVEGENGEAVADAVGLKEHPPHRLPFDAEFGELYGAVQGTQNALGLLDGGQLFASSKTHSHPEKRDICCKL